MVGYSGNAQPTLFALREPESRFTRSYSENRLIPRDSNRSRSPACDSRPLQFRVYEGQRHEQRAAWWCLLGWWRSDLHPQGSQSSTGESMVAGATAYLSRKHNGTRKLLSGDLVRKVPIGLRR